MWNNRGRDRAVEGESDLIHSSLSLLQVCVFILSPMGLGTELGNGVCLWLAGNIRNKFQCYSRK